MLIQVFYFKQMLFLKCFIGGKSGKGARKLWITDGTKEPFTGLAIFFIRTISRAITTSNVAEVYYTSCDYNMELL